jgi:hypothetical protein
MSLTALTLEMSIQHPNPGDHQVEEGMRHRPELHKKPPLVWKYGMAILDVSD